MESQLTPLQQQIYKLFADNGKKLPPFREIAKTIGVSSTNTVAYHINKLKEKGYLNSDIETSGIMDLSLKNLLSFINKAGVYVLLKNKEPFYIGESENIKNHFVQNVFNANEDVLNGLRDGKINIAYHIINDSEERKNLKDHLIDFYKSKGFKLLS